MRRVRAAADLGAKGGILNTGGAITLRVRLRVQDGSKASREDN
jgi:hypothetical protein